MTAHTLTFTVQMQNQAQSAIRELGTNFEGLGRQAASAQSALGGLSTALQGFSSAAGGISAAATAFERFASISSTNLNSVTTSIGGLKTVLGEFGMSTDRTMTNAAARIGRVATAIGELAGSAGMIQGLSSSMATLAHATQNLAPVGQALRSIRDAGASMGAAMGNLAALERVLVSLGTSSGGIIALEAAVRALPAGLAGIGAAVPAVQNLAAELAVLKTSFQMPQIDTLNRNLVTLTANMTAAAAAARTLHASVGNLPASLTAAGTAAHNVGAAAAPMNALATNVTNVGNAARASEISLRSMHHTLMDIHTIMGMGAIIGAVAGVKEIAEFDKAMAHNRAILQLSADESARLGAAYREMGASTEFGATKVASSAEEAVRAINTMAAGTDKVATATKIMQAATALTRVSGDDLATGAKDLIRIAEQFQQIPNIDKIGDIIAKTSKSATMSVHEMMISFGYVGPEFAAFGLSVNEAAAAIATLATAGIKASTAGTELRQILTRMASPTKQVREELDKLGLSFDQVNIQRHTLEEIIATFKKAGASGSDMAKLFGERGQIAGDILTALFDRFQNLLDISKHAVGAANALGVQMTDNLADAWKRLGAVVEETTLKFGDSGFANVLRDAIEASSHILMIWNGMPEKLGQTSAESAALYEKWQKWADLAETTLKTIGFALLPVVIGGIARMGMALLTISGPVGVVLAGIMALGYAARDVGVTIDGVTVSIGSLFETAKQKFEEFIGVAEITPSSGFFSDAGVQFLRDKDAAIEKEIQRHITAIILAKHAERDALAVSSNDNNSELRSTTPLPKPNEDQMTAEQKAAIDKALKSVSASAKALFEMRDNINALTDAMKLSDRALSDYGLSHAKLAELIQLARMKAGQEGDAFGALTLKIQEHIQVLGMAPEAQGVMNSLMQDYQTLASKGVIMTDEMTASLARMHAQEKMAENRSAVNAQIAGMEEQAQLRQKLVMLTGQYAEADKQLLEMEFQAAQKGVEMSEAEIKALQDVLHATHDVEEAQKKMSDTVDDVFDSIKGGLTELHKGTMNFRDAVRKMFSDFADRMFQRSMDDLFKKLADQVKGGINGLFGNDVDTSKSQFTKVAETHREALFNTDYVSAIKAHTAALNAAANRFSDAHPNTEKPSFGKNDEDAKTAAARAAAEEADAEKKRQAFINGDLERIRAYNERLMYRPQATDEMNAERAQRGLPPENPDFVGPNLPSTTSSTGSPTPSFGNIGGVNTATNLLTGTRPTPYKPLTQEEIAAMSPAQMEARAKQFEAEAAASEREAKRLDLIAGRGQGAPRVPGAYGSSNYTDIPVSDAGSPATPREVQMARDAQIEHARHQADADNVTSGRDIFGVGPSRSVAAPGNTTDQSAQLLNQGLANQEQALRDNTSALRGLTQALQQAGPSIKSDTITGPTTTSSGAHGFANDDSAGSLSGRTPTPSQVSDNVPEDQGASSSQGTSVNGSIQDLIEALNNLADSVDENTEALKTAGARGLGGPHDRRIEVTDDSETPTTPGLRPTNGVNPRGNLPQLMSSRTAVGAVGQSAPFVGSAHDYDATIRRIETGSYEGNYSEENKHTRAAGAYQMMGQELGDTGYINTAATPKSALRAKYTDWEDVVWSDKARALGITDYQSFLGNKAAQDAIMQDVKREQDRQMSAKGISEWPGYTHDELRAMTHFAGAGGTSSFLRNGTNTGDAEGTSRSRYVDLYRRYNGGAPATPTLVRQGAMSVRPGSMSSDMSALEGRRRLSNQDLPQLTAPTVDTGGSTGLEPLPPPIYVPSLKVTPLQQKEQPDLQNQSLKAQLGAAAALSGSAGHLDQAAQALRNPSFGGIGGATSGPAATGKPTNLLWGDTDATGNPIAPTIKFHQESNPFGNRQQRPYYVDPAIASGVYHTGGVVGSGSAVMRNMPSSLFDNAPRLHGGGTILGHNEVPAILQHGETVIPAGGGGGSSLAGPASALMQSAYGLSMAGSYLQASAGVVMKGGSTLVNAGQNNPLVNQHDNMNYSQTVNAIPPDPYAGVMTRGLASLGMMFAMPKLQSGLTSLFGGGTPSKAGDTAGKDELKAPSTGDAPTDTPISDSSSHSVTASGLGDTYSGSNGFFGSDSVNTTAGIDRPISDLSSPNPAAGTGQLGEMLQNTGLNNGDMTESLGNLGDMGGGGGLGSLMDSIGGGIGDAASGIESAFSGLGLGSMIVPAIGLLLGLLFPTKSYTQQDRDISTSLSAVDPATGQSLGTGSYHYQHDQAKQVNGEGLGLPDPNWEHPIYDSGKMYLDPNTRQYMLDLYGYDYLSNIDGNAGNLPRNFSPYTYHTGGVVGQGSQRSVPAEVFHSAQRYHIGGDVGDLPGLGPNEVPVIANRGERILTEDQASSLSGLLGRSGHSALTPRALSDSHRSSTSPGNQDGNSMISRPTIVQMTVNTPDADSFRKSAGQISHEMSAALSRSGRRNG